MGKVKMGDGKVKDTRLCDGRSTSMGGSNLERGTRSKRKHNMEGKEGEKRESRREIFQIRRKPE